MAQRKSTKAITVHEAKTRLSQLIERACAGEEIIISRGKTPVVRLVPITEKPIERRFGAMRGKAQVTDAFFEALPEDELDAWEG